MKFPYVVILALIIGSTLSAAGDPHLRRAQELIDWIEGDMEGTIVVMFYDHNSPESRIKAMREEIEREILRPNSGFHYYEVDVVIEDYAGVIEMCELNLKEIKHSPTLMITSDGNGYWAHGQGAVQEIKYQLPNYSIEIRRELDFSSAQLSSKDADSINQHIQLAKTYIQAFQEYNGQVKSFQWRWVWSYQFMGIAMSSKWDLVFDVGWKVNFNETGGDFFHTSLFLN